MRTRLRFLVEALEDRTLPSTVGVPWGDPQRLAISFPRDGTEIAAHGSDLFSTLAPLTAAVWQREMLAAFQTWAVHSNLNFRLRSDVGLPFGSPGLLQGDLRFGDIRIGAQRMGEEVLAISVPHDPFVSGTLAGEIFLNSAHTFQAEDLFPLMLHEVGHVLGLGHSDDPLSPMFSHLNRHTQLTNEDIENLRHLYGPRRPDVHEGPYGNDSFARATTIRFPTQGHGYYGTTPLVVFGDLTTQRDTDFFALRPYRECRGTVTFRLQSKGLSLLAPRLTLYDAEGQMIARATSENPSDVLVVRLGDVNPETVYYVQVESQVDGIFGIGAYGLGVTFEGNVAVPPERLDQLLRGPHETLSVDDLARLAVDPNALLNLDSGINESFQDATRLETAAELETGFGRSEVIASLEDGTDVDVYRFRTPQPKGGAETLVLTVSVREFPANGLSTMVELYRENETRQPSEVLVRSNGTYTLQASGARAGADFFARVRHAGVPEGAGNYSLTLHFGGVQAGLELFADSALPPEQPAEQYALYVAQSQLFQFVYSEIRRRPAHVRMHMTIHDEHGNQVLAMSLRGGETATADGVFLKPGPYTVNFRAESPGSGHTVLRGRTISDPIGPVIDDPSLNPMYGSGEAGVYLYPGDVLSRNPFLWVFLGGL